MTNTLFPVFLKTDAAHFLIVGGGNVGLEKTETLLRQNPKVKITVVATYFHQRLIEIGRKHENVNLLERPFQETDITDKDFIIIATNVPDINLKVFQLAKAKGIKVNAADQPDLCDFYLGSIVNKGNLKIAISTNGKSPVLARRLREYFEETIPDEIDQSIENLNQFRKTHNGTFQEKLVDLDKATEALAQNHKTKKNKEKTNYQKMVFQITILFLAIFFGYGLASVISFDDLRSGIQEIPSAFYIMLAVGFFAQMVDGAVGLGYGVTCSTSMMLFGIKLPAISGSIHTAEMFSSGISGFSHYKFGNVNKKLFLWLCIPGVIGAVSGALLLIYLGDKYEKITYGILASYTILIGIRLIVISFRKNRKHWLFRFFRWFFRFFWRRRLGTNSYFHTFGKRKKI